MIFLVVTDEETSRPLEGIAQRTKTIRIIRPVFQCAGTGLRIGVIIKVGSDTCFAEYHLFSRLILRYSLTSQNVEFVPGSVAASKTGKDRKIYTDETPRLSRVNKRML